MIKVENERPYHSTEVVIGHEGIRKSPIYFSFPSRFRQGYQNELEHFLDVVTRKFLKLLHLCLNDSNS